MKTKANILAGFFLLLILSLYSQAQNFNRTVSANDVHHNSISDAWRFSINPGLGFVVNSHSIPGINANRLGTNLTGRKYFGNVGLGITGGIMAGNISNDAVSTFLSDRNYPADATVTKSNPSNSYLLFGPAVRFGKKVQFGAELSGGLFLNDAGSFTVTPLGAGRPIYSLENGNKNLFPGFSGNVHIDYPINKSTHFFISTGYLQTKSSNLILDIKQGIDIPKLQNQDLKLFTAGIGIRKSFGGRKGENSDGLSASTNGGYTAQNRGDIKYPRDASSGLPTGKRSYFRGNQNNGNTGTTSCGPVSLRTTNTDGSISEMTFACPQDAAKFRAHREPPTESYNPWEMDDDVEGTVMNPMIGNDGKNTSSSSSCGPVTIRTTNPDGTVTETTFACPQDAAQFQQRSSSVNSLNNSMPTSRLSMTPTTAKQTQGKTFGEQVATSLQSRSILKNLPDSLKRNIIVGKVSRGADNVLGIETNQSIAEKTKPKEDTVIRQKQHADGLFRLSGDMGGGPGGGPRVLLRSSDLLLPAVPKFYLTDSKISKKEWMDDWNPQRRVAGDGGGLTHEDDWEAPTVRKTSEQKNSIGETEYFDIEWPELKVSLLDASNGTVLATTLTEPDGQFFFANLPTGTYAVRVEGSISTISQYDVTLNKKASFGGVIKATNENWSFELNTGTGTAEQAAAYVQKTKTKSNNSNDRLMNTSNDNSGIVWSPQSNLKILPVIIGDVDRDGLEEMVIGTGAIAGITGGAVARPGNPIGGIIVKGGKNPGGSMITTTTNSNGEFEFTNLKPGSYNITMEGTIILDDLSFVIVGDDQNNNLSKSGVQDHNSSRSNKTASVVEPNDNNNNSNIIVRGWDPKKKESTQRNINTSQDNLKSLSAELDKLEQQMKRARRNTWGSGGSTNGIIENLRAAIADVQQTLNTLQQKDKEAALSELDQKTSAMNKQFAELQNSLSGLGNEYSSVSNTLKTKHDTVKNSINNVR